MERALDAVIGQEIRKLNKHLPKQKQSLSALLKLDHPTVEAVDGSSIIFNKSELQELGSFVPKEYHDMLMLPMVILRRMELGRSAYSVMGNRLEEFTVMKILGLTDDEYYQMHKQRQEAVFYRPQVVELIRKYHSLVVIAFGAPSEQSS